jgi:hypothetical protein
MATLSSDLIWEVTRGNSSTLVKRKQAGGVQFSKDPLNLRNQYSRKVGIHDAFGKECLLIDCSMRV